MAWEAAAVKEGFRLFIKISIIVIRTLLMQYMFKPSFHDAWDDSKSAEVKEWLTLEEKSQTSIFALFLGVYTRAPCKKQQSCHYALSELHPLCFDSTWFLVCDTTLSSSPRNNIPMTKHSKKHVCLSRGQTKSWSCSGYNWCLSAFQSRPDVLERHILPLVWHECLNGLFSCCHLRKGNTLEWALAASVAAESHAVFRFSRWSATLSRSM